MGNSTRLRSLNGPIVLIGRFRVPLAGLVLAVLVSAVAWYVIAANAYVGMTYRISDAASLRSALNGEIETLQTSIVDTSMLEELETKAGVLGFMPIKDPVYLAVPGTVVARR